MESEKQYRSLGLRIVSIGPNALLERWLLSLAGINPLDREEIKALLESSCPGLVVCGWKKSAVRDESSINHIFDCAEEIKLGDPDYLVVLTGSCNEEVSFEVAAMQLVEKWQEENPGWTFSDDSLCIQSHGCKVRVEFLLTSTEE